MGATVTRKQLAFLIGYPIAYYMLSAVFTLMAISTGLGPADAGDLPPTRGQEIMSSVGHSALQVLWFPFHLTFNLMKIVPGPEWLGVLVVGFLQGCMLLAIYRTLLKRGNSRKF